MYYEHKNKLNTILKERHIHNVPKKKHLLKEQNPI